MARTKKGTKAPGYEYWSKRPKSGCVPSKSIKKITHKIERAKSKVVARKLKDKDDASST